MPAAAAPLRIARDIVMTVAATRRSGHCRPGKRPRRSASLPLSRGTSGRGANGNGTGVTFRRHAVTAAGQATARENPPDESHTPGFAYANARIRRPQRGPAIGEKRVPGVDLTQLVSSSRHGPAVLSDWRPDASRVAHRASPDNAGPLTPALLPAKNAGTRLGLTLASGADGGCLTKVTDRKLFVIEPQAHGFASRQINRANPAEALRSSPNASVSGGSPSRCSLAPMPLVCETASTSCGCLAPLPFSAIRECWKSIDA
jgi:hypothetical protein